MLQTVPGAMLSSAAVEGNSRLPMKCFHYTIKWFGIGSIRGRSLHISKTHVIVILLGSESLSMYQNCRNILNKIMVALSRRVILILLHFALSLVSILLAHMLLSLSFSRHKERQP
jgi:hypothetical protein